MNETMTPDTNTIAKCEVLRKQFVLQSDEDIRENAKVILAELESQCEDELTAYIVTDAVYAVCDYLGYNDESMYAMPTYAAIYTVATYGCDEEDSALCAKVLRMAAFKVRCLVALPLAFGIWTAFGVAEDYVGDGLLGHDFKALMTIRLMMLEQSIKQTELGTVHADSLHN